MPPTYKCELRKIYCVPDLDKGDTVLVGLMFFSDEVGLARVKFTTDFDCLKCLNPFFDVEIFSGFEEFFKSKIAEPESRAVFLNKVPDWASNSLQMSAPTAVLAGDPAVEFDLLVRRYLEAKHSPRRHEASMRTRIHKEMTRVFEEHDLLKHLFSDLPVNEYVPNDTLKLDYAYRTADHLRIYHAVPVERTLDGAKNVAFSYPQFHDAFAERNKIEPQLTAIVEAHDGVVSANRNFAYRAFQGSGIIAATVDELARIASEARKELSL
jgi:Protein of unknown function (DUF3037)